MTPSSLLLVVTVAVAAPLGAQQPDSAGHAPRESVLHHHGSRHDRRQLGWQRYGHLSNARARRDPFVPSRLLARKDALGLTAQQVAQLTALEGNERTALLASRRQSLSERAAIVAGLKADAPDTLQLKRQYEALQTAAGEAQWARVRTSLQARAVLDEAQRGKVRGWAAGGARRRISRQAI